MAPLATKAELKSKQDEILQTFDLGCFYGTNHALKPFYRYLKRLLITFIFQGGNLKDCLHLKGLAQTIDRINAKIQVKCDGRCLKQEKKKVIKG